MKSTYNYLAGAAFSLALGLALSSPAQAQTTTYGVGSCMGTYMNQMLGGSTQIYVGDPNDTTKGSLIPTSYSGSVFNKAECQCKSRDIYMHFLLNPALGAVPNDPGTSMYIGIAGCENSATRMTSVCDQVSTMPSGDKFKSRNPFDAIIPPEVVTNPESATNYTECKTGGPQSYTITVTVGPDAMPAVCTLPVAVNTEGPPAPDGLTATKGDGGLTLNWSVPEGTSGIKWYQVLCRKQQQKNQPAMSQEFLDKTPSYFSACIGNQLYRQKLGDLPTDPVRTAEPPFGNDFIADPRLRCSDKISPGTSQMSTRLSGLENGTTYEVMVVSIDTFGNPTPSAVVTGTPQSNQSALGDYCEGDNCPGFGCQAGPGGSSAAGAGMTAAGLMMLGLLLGRRARRAA